MSSPETSRVVAPDPDDDRKPDSPTDLHGRAWRLAAKRAFREFTDDQCTDLAAALTYYSVLAIFPAAIALVSLVGVFGKGKETVDTLLQILNVVGASSATETLRGPLEQLASSQRAGLALVLGLVGDPQKMVGDVLRITGDVGVSSVDDTLKPILTQLTEAPAAGFALILGLVLALWSASGYVAAFSRGMNRVYEIDEGRPIWKLRPVLLLVTVILVVLAVAIVVAVVLSGGIARSVGASIGLSDVTVTVWNIVKWPVIVALVVVAIAVLYYATPNVRQPKFRWISVGAIVALVVWVLASLAFGFYVANFSSYDKTYGSLAGFIVFLLWLWITNLALLFGAELDAEVERGRELQGGIEAEKTIQLPPRDTRASEKKQAKQEEDVRIGRALRRSRGADSTTDTDD